MPWQEVVTVELRQQFVHDALRRVVPVTELCAAYGISRHSSGSMSAQTPGRGVPSSLSRDRRRRMGRLLSRPLRLGRFHERTLLIEDALGRHYRRRY